MINPRNPYPKKAKHKAKPSQADTLFAGRARQEGLCLRILHLIRDELYLDFRYFDRALAMLAPEADESLQTLATDGIKLYYVPEQLIRLYPKNPVFLNRALLHSLLHCIFRHPWLRNGGDIPLWNLASDIAVEYMIDLFDKASVRRIRSGIRTRLYRSLEESGQPVSAPLLYEEILKNPPGSDSFRIFDLEFPSIEVLAREFHVDDHRRWPGDEKASPTAAQASSAWEKLGRRMDQELTMSGEDGANEGRQIISQIQTGRRRRSYSDFLRKFTVLQEELHINQDEFDLAYYTYGLQLYGNLPLIEPPESREVRKVRDLVIVIDTSYSTRGSLVRSFLTRTFEILQEKDHFFSRSRVCILQCDDKVRDHILVESDQDIRRLLSSFSLTGGGGTDFRPAFRYIAEKIKEGDLQDPQGILYFTDGKGIFPDAPPPYRTAFIFYGQKAPDAVPPWAMKLELSERDLSARKRPYSHPKATMVH